LARQQSLIMAVYIRAAMGSTFVKLMPKHMRLEPAMII